MSKSNPILDIKDLSAGYDSQQVLKDVSFQLNNGEILGLIGPNGSGKSTLMKTINGLLPKISGKITLKNREIDNIETSNLVDIGISFFTQSGLIIPDLTIEEHLILAEPKNSNERNNFTRVYDTFPNLYNDKAKRAGNLSGGERQTLSFAILLVQKTDTWLLDEPTAGLSPDRVHDTVQFLKKINQKKNISMLLIEHNMDVAFALSNNIAVTKNKTLTRKFNQSEFRCDNFLKNYVFN